MTAPPAKEAVETERPPAKRYVYPRRNEEWRTIYYIARFVLHLFYTLSGKYRVEGMENIPKRGPVILAPNHASFLDPPLVGVALRRPIWFMSKEELFLVPIFGKLMPYFQGFPVRRGTADRAALRKALELLARGEIVLIFPEGERSKDGRLKPPELGISMVALRSRATVIPVAITGSREMLPPGAKQLKRGQLRVLYGAPVDLGDLYERRENRETLNECADRIMVRIAALLGVPPPVASAEGAEPMRTSPDISDN